MEIQQLETFVQLHGYKVSKQKNRCVFLAQYSDIMPLDTELIKFNEANVLDYFVMSERPCQWLMSQLRSYDFENEVLIGLIFDKKKVFAHVIKK